MHKRKTDVEAHRDTYISRITEEMCKRCEKGMQSCRESKYYI